MSNPINKAFGGSRAGMKVGAAMSPDVYLKMAAAIHEQQQGRTLGLITVSDAERLAKAGVQINFSDIASRLVPDPPPKREHHSLLTDRLLERYLPTWRAKFSGPFAGDGGTLFPFQFWATEHGDKVHVYVAPTDGREPVVLVDEKVIFPSDTLIASINLLEKCK